MDSMPGYAQSYPPPPPPQRSRKGLWIGLAIGAAVLCLCCIIIFVGVYFFGQNIPFISNFLPSPIPTGLFYNNPAAGISLTYPLTWQYSESGDATNGYIITFASSADILNNSSNSPQTGAALEIITTAMKASDLSFTVNASSMGDVVDYLASSSNLSQGQNLRTFTLSGYPAASGVYTLTNDTGGASAVYLTTVLRNDEIILFIGVCPQTEWSQHQPAFDSIVNSASIVTP